MRIQIDQQFCWMKLPCFMTLLMLWTTAYLRIFGDLIWSDELHISHNGSLYVAAMWMACHLPSIYTILGEMLPYIYIWGKFTLQFCVRINLPYIHGSVMALSIYYEPTSFGPSSAPRFASFCWEHLIRCVYCNWTGRLPLTRFKSHKKNDGSKMVGASSVCSQDFEAFGTHQQPVNSYRESKKQTEVNLTMVPRGKSN